MINPALKTRPVVVLSNNDGCIIARSNEAKALGIGMGVPVFKVKHIIDKHGIVMCSANHHLYQEVSDKVMSALAAVVEELEIYSIDEAFFSLGKQKPGARISLEEQIEFVRKTIEEQTDIPVSIGIARTKTLAKLANQIAKDKGVGTYNLVGDLADTELTNAFIDAHLADIPANQIWGVGRSSQQLLQKHGVYTALDLKYVNDTWIKQNFNVNGMRTILELRSIPCFLLDPERNEEPNRSILSSRSFGAKVFSIEEVKEAVANFVHIAARKLRAQKLVTKQIYIHLRVDNGEHFRGSVLEGGLKLSSPSSETPELILAAHKIVDEIFVPGLTYRKAGVMLCDLRMADDMQLNLFPSDNRPLSKPLVSIRGRLKKDSDRAERTCREMEDLGFRRKSIDGVSKSKPISAVVDQLNQKLGINTIFWAAMGNPHKTRTWKARQEHKNLQKN